MVTSFNTPAASGGAGAKEGGGNTIITLVVVAGLAYLAYRFLIKPELDRRKAEQAKQ